ncbi:hypothetical protein AB205_0060720 [Aquarana catesbeiana]|uniref:Cohesin subunit SCC3/SA HEAT-repeats domain-containing protein n=1 Tax=Aquarana catesbeiana TaxID=8400 RepID=A0A2G9SCH5_AQUCT|nr:hypothetical protein AB205_0060720 [Aquarana catesbeiana]
MAALLSIYPIKSREPRAERQRVPAGSSSRVQLGSNLEDVGNMMNSLFKGVFVHRYRNMENIFSADECASVDILVYTTNRFVASAAGDFLYQRLLRVDLEELSPDRRNRHDTDVIFFQRLMSFFNSSKLHEHAAYLVDSLWDSAGTRLKDWECQTDMLLMEADLIHTFVFQEYVQKHVKFFPKCALCLQRHYFLMAPQIRLGEVHLSVFQVDLIRPCIVLYGAADVS